MSRFSFCSLLILFVISVSAQCNSNTSKDCYDLSEVSSIQGVYYYNGYPLTGCIESKAGTDPRAILPVVNGVLDGKYVEYYGNNRPLLIQEYSQGIKEGLYVIYWENSVISDSFYYKNGSPDGNLVGYHEDGSERSWDYYENGKSEGPVIFFLDSAKNEYFWGERNLSVNVGDWYYKLDTDSCFIRTFTQNNESFDTPCSCDEIIYPPFDDW